ncbi:protein transporter tim10 [Entomophthora muscae]|uniref:Protein transporter tim10 n=1 Tax=Entomophthora muscae TaxID=34485 RepID=A0ACC2UJP3_9FUNG|nr:protein transporter tim10 [Entomophthora muscae]
MGWLGGSTKDKSAYHMTEEDFKMVKINHTATLNLLSSAFELCNKKCVNTSGDVDAVTRIEGICIDKCLAKFFVMMPKINEICQEHQQRNAK